MLRQKLEEKQRQLDKAEACLIHMNNRHKLNGPNRRRAGSVASTNGGQTPQSGSFLQSVAAANYTYSWLSEAGRYIFIFSTYILTFQHLTFTFNI